MSRHAQDGHEHQSVPLNQDPEEQDQPPIALHTSIAAEASPSPSAPGVLASIQTAPAAAQIMQNHPLYCDPQQILIVTPAYLAAFLGDPDIISESPDLWELAGHGTEAARARTRARAEQLARTGRVREWLSSPGSSQLLVHGSEGPGAHVSGLSLFCMTLTHVLAVRAPLCIPLAFYCGLHSEVPDGDDDDDDDDDEEQDELSGSSNHALGGAGPEPRDRADTEPVGDAHTGGRAVIRSFIYRLLYYINRNLLCYFRGGGIPVAAQELDAIQNGDLGSLSELFRRLVHMLPSGVTLYCLVDGGAYYERDEFLGDFQRVLVPILQLSGQGETRAAIKVLVTSPTGTSDICEWFAEESILSMPGVRRGNTSMGASRGRLVQELESAIH